jgi:hypothetical protein
VADDHYEPNRFLGFPVRTGATGPAGATGPRAKRQEEPQRVLGFPVDFDWFADARLDWLDSLTHPVRTCQRWLRRRRLGPSAIDEDRPRR